LEASPGRVANSLSKVEMWEYQRAAWGNFSASGVELRALKTATSACEGAKLQRAG
jgi:hypothetical protein